MKKINYVCCICHKNQVGFGNNPAPLGKAGQRCCDECNDSLVIPARIRLISIIEKKYFN